MLSLPNSCNAVAYNIQYYICYDYCKIVIFHFLMSRSIKWHTLIIRKFHKYQLKDNFVSLISSIHVIEIRLQLYMVLYVFVYKVNFWFYFSLKAISMEILGGASKPKPQFLSRDFSKKFDV